MTDDPKPDARTLWRDQPPEETPPMTLAQIHARGYQSRIRWRNGREYVAGAVAIAGCAFLAVRPDVPLVRIGLVVMMLGVLVSMWQLYRRASARAVPAMTAESSLAFHRQQLVRQRDALRSIGFWYLLPYVPGFALVILGRWLQHPERWAPNVIMAAIMVVVLGGILLLNLKGAEALQKQIDELDALTGTD